jgi:hypothetical protein
VAPRRRAPLAALVLLVPAAFVLVGRRRRR